MFSVHLYQRVIRPDGERNFRRRLKLPFAPFPGLVIDLSDNDPGFNYAHIREVEWCVSGQEFHCQCATDAERDPESGLWLEDSVDIYLENGWNLHGEPYCAPADKQTL